LKVKVQYVDIPAGKRVFVASDLHAHGMWLRELLEKAAFCDDDMLFLVGDYLERGTESLKTLRYVMELCSRPNVYATMGNVDYWAMAMYDAETPAKTIKDRVTRLRGWHDADVFSEYCEELGLPYETEEEILFARDKIASVYADEIAFINNLPTIIDTPFYTFVHGGLPAKDLSAIDMSNSHPLMKFDHFINKGIVFDKWVVVGHWPTTLCCSYAMNMNPFITFEQNIIDVDGGSGVKDAGQVNLLIIPHAGEDVFTWQYKDGFPLYRALDPQRQSKDSININWVDRWLEVLQETESLVYVRRISDGYECWMPKNYVAEENGKMCADGDFSDFRPEIAVGDTVALVRKDAIGTFIKKDGICGYYDGRLEPIV